MDVSPTDARQSLDEVHDVAARTRKAVVSSITGPILMVWGIVWITAFLASDWWPRWSGWVWLVLDVLGFVGTWLIVFGLRPAVTMSPASRGLAWRIFALWLSLIPFAVVWLLLLAPVRGPQVAAFICTVAMLFLVVMGLWVETYSLVLLGFAVTGSVVLGYLQFPAHFNLWMALTGGGTMFAVGLLMRLRWR